MYVNLCCTFRRHNCINYNAENVLKLRDLTVEIELMRNVKTKVIPGYGQLEPSHTHSENT
jgi:hypothetical protein